MQVAAHERSLREQAKKMNIKSLRSNEDNKKASAEFRLAKVSKVLQFRLCRLDRKKISKLQFADCFKHV